MKINSSSLSTLNGKTFVIELGHEIRFKVKQELINYLREQNAHISYILTASTDYVLVSNDIDTYKTRRAKQLGIPLVNIEYIYEYRRSLNGNDLIDIKKYFVTSAEDKENFSKSGTIPVAGGSSSSNNTIKPIKIDVSKIKIWNADDVELPKFDELTHAEIGKWAIFKETNDHSDVYFALELQIIPDEYSNSNTNDYRIRFRYEKQTITNSKGKISLIQYAFSNDINELHQLYASYFNRIGTMPRILRIHDLLPDNLGSKLLFRSLFIHRMDTQMLDEHVCQLIESLWIESIGDLNKILTVQPETIALQTIIEAEAALLEIKSDSKSASEAETRFYSLIPHRSSSIVDLINNRHALIEKLDLCQMLHDMATVNELTNWNIKASIEAKYRALKCHIETIDKDSHEYLTISEMIHSTTNPDEQVIIHQIYNVAKQMDALNFRSTLSNQKQLFHGSKYKNFLGILSRGLLLPKMVVDDLGITRTDFGCLGYGIYFSDSISTSLKYTTASSTRSNRRLICISQVALGESAKFYSYSTNLTQPPEHFHSTHGVKRTNENNSKFLDDEYVIYNLDQQRLVYIVELSWIPHDQINQSLQILPISRDFYTSNSFSEELDIPSIIDDESIQIAEQDYGLICPSSGQLIPLKAFHVRAQLVDITAEVVLYQVYHNTNSVPIEAKYVFPLDENCSICDFEAHINNKIIKGIVKEKEQAKREYREAIEKGHGAYLMHQEQPEVFSVSVGNLPANCEVIIKITYVAELPIENNDIIFRFPAKIASWQSKQALENRDQTILPSINLDQENSSMKSVEFSLKTSIRMPYEIVKIFSPTHRLRRKITDCIAMIELIDNSLFEKDFLLSITLKTMNIPRLLNEISEKSNENSQASMLIFYPKFEIEENFHDLLELIILIDVSNSMDGKHVQQAKQLAHLFLTNIKQERNLFFNIVTFGSDNHECFPISVSNTKENLDKAKHFILHSLDHRGNTDLFSVLRQYSLFSSISKFGRQFLLISDGHINDLKSIFTLLKTQSSMSHDRLFTCSIGETSNKYQLKQLANQANAGGLCTIFDSNYRSKWKTKVIQILEHIHQPCVTNLSIDWHGTIDFQQEKFIDQAPKMIRSLFNGMRLTVYRFIKNCHKATLKLLINEQEYLVDVFSNRMTETKGNILHCLTARSIINDYENGLLNDDQCENELLKKQSKQDLIELSIKYSIISSFTSFVAIEERDDQAIQSGVRLLDVMLENDIDLLPYINWDGERSQIDLIKEKLINGKRLFNSASITNKIQLINEYEEYCQKISYRSGGEAKYELMLIILDTYQNLLKDDEKVRELIINMQKDLTNEINQTIAEEREILEKRLNEINEKLVDMNKTNIVSENLDDLVDYYDDEAGSEEVVSSRTSTSDVDFASLRRISMDLLCQMQEECEESILPVPAKQAEARSSDEGEDMGFGLFDDDNGGGGGGGNSAPLPVPAKQTEAWSSDEGEGMGFGLFDDDDGGGGYSASPIVAAGAGATAASKGYVLTKEIKKSDEEAYDDDMGTSSIENDERLYASVSSEKDEKLAVNTMKDAIKTKSTKKEDASMMDLLKCHLGQRKSFLSGKISPTSSFAKASSTTTFGGASKSVTSEPVTQATSGAFSFEAKSVSPLPPPAPISNATFSFGATLQPPSCPVFAPLLPPPVSVFESPPPPPPPVFAPPPPAPTLNAKFSFGAPLPPPLSSTAAPSFGAPPSFSFGTPVPPPLSSTTAPSFGAPPSFSFGAPVPPPPLPSITASSFGATPSFSFGAPLPPPPPPLPSTTAPSFGAPPSFSFGAPLPPPPPLPSATVPSFGAPSAFSFMPPPRPGSAILSFTPPASSLFGVLSHPPQQSQQSQMMSAHGSMFEPYHLSMSHPQATEPLSQSTWNKYQWSNTFGTINTDSIANAAPCGDDSFSTLTTTTSTTSLITDVLTSSLNMPKPMIENEKAKGDRSALNKSFSGSRGGKANQFQQRATIKDAEDDSKLLEKNISLKSMAQETVCDLAMDVADICSIESSEQMSFSPIVMLPSVQLKADSDEDLFGTVSKKKTKKKSSFSTTSTKPNEFLIGDLLLLDVTPLGLGVEDSNGHMCTMITRNRTIPTRTPFHPVFTNAYAYQTTATIRIFTGEHKLTKYNIFLGEFSLTGLTPNFASQTLVISISFDLDANGILRVTAQEERSGAKATFQIDDKTPRLGVETIEQHVQYVETDPDFRAKPVENRRENDRFFMLKGETEGSQINFTSNTTVNKNILSNQTFTNINLTLENINRLKQMQLSDGSFELNDSLANLLSTNMKYFDEFKQNLVKQGLNSLALNIRNEILRLIATGIILMECFFQIETSQRKTYLVPFDREQIRSIFHLHLPKDFLTTVDKAIDFFEQKRLSYGLYCEQLELNYSSWEKFIQYSIFHIDN